MSAAYTWSTEWSKESVFKKKLIFISSVSLNTDNQKTGLSVTCRCIHLYHLSNLSSSLSHLSGKGWDSQWALEVTRESGGALARASLPAPGLMFAIISKSSTAPTTIFYMIFLSFTCSDLFTGLHGVQLLLQLNTVVPGSPQCFHLSLKVSA